MSFYIGDYMYAWCTSYSAHPGDLSPDDLYQAYADHCTGGFTFDGTEYRAWGFDPSLPDDLGVYDEAVDCPGPYLPPLQGPPPPDDAMADGPDWATRCAAFVYDEQAEQQLRDEQEAYRFQHLTPGVYFREF